jgi:hypothetical protein
MIGNYSSLLHISQAVNTMLGAIEFRSFDGLIEGCSGDAGRKDAGEPCAAPEWTREHPRAVSRTLALRMPEGEESPAPLSLRGEGPEGLRLAVAGAGARGDTVRDLLRPQSRPGRRGRRRSTAPRRPSSARRRWTKRARALPPSASGGVPLG